MEIGRVPIVSKGPRWTKKCIDVGRGIINVVLGAWCRNKNLVKYTWPELERQISSNIQRVYPSRFSDGILQNPAQNIEKWMICIVENIDNAAACCDWVMVTRHKTSAGKTSYETVLCSVRGIFTPKIWYYYQSALYPASCTHRAPPLFVESHYRRCPIGEGLSAFNVGSLDMTQLNN